MTDRSDIDPTTLATFVQATVGATMSEEDARRISRMVQAAGQAIDRLESTVSGDRRFDCEPADFASALAKLADEEVRP
jgi:hypothetical protein